MTSLYPILVDREIAVRDAFAGGARLGPDDSSPRSVRAEWGKVSGRDTKLRREVAIKILPETFAGDRHRAKASLIAAFLS